MLDGKDTREDIPEDLTTDDMMYFKYAPITSVYVERSSYTRLLTDRRCRLLFESIRQILIEQCNMKIN